MLRTRARLTVAVAALAAAAVAVAAVAFSGGDGGRLAWVGQPLVFTPEQLPQDRILRGEIRNDSLEDIEMWTRDARVLDAEGRTVHSGVRFIAAFGHGLYPLRDRVDSEVGLPEFERIGELARLRPGERAPITLSWRTRPGQPQPTTVDFGTARLTLPR